MTMTTGFKDIDGFASAGIIKLRREVISLLEKFAASPPGPSEIIGDGDGGGDHSHLYWELRFLCRYKSRGFEKMVVIPPGVKHWPLRLAVYGHSAMIQLSNNFFQCSYDLTNVCELRGKSETTEIILLLLTLLRRCQVAGLPGEILTRHSASLASHLALLLTRDFRLPPPPSVSTFELAVYYVVANSCRSSLSAVEIAESFNISPNYLARLFRRHAGMTAQRFIIITRLRRACELLREGGYPISEVARLTGWNDHAHFSTMFRRFIGVTPSRFSSGFHSGVWKHRLHSIRPEDVDVTRVVLTLLEESAQQP